jgi:ribosome-binding factor A
MDEKQRGRVEETIRQLVAELLVRRVKDPRVANVSITYVDLSRDYSVAKLSYNVVGGSDDLEEVRKGLESCKGFIRGQIKRRVRLRTIPELIFVYDTSLDRAMEIEDLIHKIHEERHEREDGDGNE